MRSLGFLLPNLHCFEIPTLYSKVFPTFADNKANKRNKRGQVMCKKKLLILGICMTGLTACSSMQQTTYTRYINYQPYRYVDTNYYPQSYEGGTNYDEQRERSEVHVPESYHVGSYHSPTSHKDIDKTWVNSQSPHNYTIEIADSEKPALVAGKLYKVPKSDHQAEIKYYRNGKSYYRGVYGSYNSYDEAQRALNNLPADLRQGASIQSWDKVQNNSGY